MRLLGLICPTLRNRSNLDLNRASQCLILSNFDFFFRLSWFRVIVFFDNLIEFGFICLNFISSDTFRQGKLSLSNKFF